MNPSLYAPEQSLYIQLTQDQLDRFYRYTKKPWEFGEWRGNCAAWVDGAFEATFPGSTMLVTDFSPGVFGATTPRAVSKQLIEWKALYPNNSLTSPLHITGRK